VGEDKAFGVAADATGVFVVGSTPAGLSGAPALGGMDGWIARYSTDGVRQWVSAVGGTRKWSSTLSTPATDAGAAGGAVLVSGLTYGTPAGASAPGNGDVFLATVDPAKGLP
jgi:hypothetical protein